MKIERVSSDKFRVRISRDELREMNVNPEMFFSDSNALNTLIMRILCEIHEKTDFEPFIGSMTMEASPDRDGMNIVLSKGTDITETDIEDELPDIADIIKRLDDNISKEDRFETKGLLSGGIIDVSGRLKKTADRNIHRKIRSVKAVKGKSQGLPQTFVFDSFDDMCRALCRLSSKTAEVSELYILRDKYMIIVPVITNVLDDLAMLMEFASEIKRGMVYEHVKEHGKCIAKGMELSRMCSKIEALV